MQRSNPPLAPTEARCRRRTRAGERLWVENMRLVEFLRDYVKKRLEDGDFVDEQGGQSAEEQLREHASKQNDDVEMEEGDEGKGGEKDGKVLYPNLKGMDRTYAVESE
ncbi:hypothetical protein EPUS_03438 [Endocarpon pusillum Z07020]|uniref:Uncharacterized protein n=1 Tax=Endocarpon pusillum (strain Z07020 / HMAS-L-300199) TaxID=1263415 RepID=U1GPL2_ENDPU|nr:uncharacterized protein EPUS_03438 [Endocarpon pusillum Z07020]ERF74248.1 hypothetical protein EPUS_03438 [Endocarpon pusillum Z07020]